MLCFALAACSADRAEEADPAPADPITFEGNPRAFCSARQDAWLISLLNRIGEALPPEFESHTLQLEGGPVPPVHIQQRMRGEPDETELMLRLTVSREGAGTIQLPAYGRIDPETCAVDQLEAHVGYYPLSPETERFPIP